YQALAARLTQEGLKLSPGKLPVASTRHSTGQNVVVPPARVRYLAEIAETVRGYHGWAKEQAKIARERQQLKASRAMLDENMGYKDRLVSSGHVADAEAAAQIDITTTNAEHALDALVAEREKQ